MNNGRHMIDIEKLIEQLNEHVQSYTVHDDPNLINTLKNSATALSTLQAENAEIQKQLNEFSEFLCYITGGLLSKTNYTAPEMITTAEYYQQKRCDECNLRAENIRWCQVASEQDKAVEHLQEENEKLRAELEQVEKYIRIVEFQRNAAIDQLHGYCPFCTHYTPNHNEGPCRTCKHEYYHLLNNESLDNWEWCGPKKED